MNRMLQAIDMPPIWLVVFAALGVGVGRLWSVTLPAAGVVGPALMVLGAVLMVVALLQMVARKTTFIPRRDPSALVTGGVFGLSRNPIYLADALLLAGLLIWSGAALALPLVPLFMVLITRRFILGEEARIATHFGAEFEAYCGRTRRWL